MCFERVENYTNIVYSEQNMGLLKLDLYVAAASNMQVEIIDFFDIRKIFVTRSRPRDVEQLKEAFAILGFEHKQYWLISVTFSIPAIIFLARRHIHDAEHKVIQRIHRRLGDALYLLKHLQTERFLLSYHSVAIILRNTNS